MKQDRLDATEAEQALLGAVMIDASVFGILSDRVLAEDFAHPQHRAIWQAYADLDLIGAEPDYLTVTEAISRQCNPPSVPIDYLMQLAERTPLAANAKPYAARVVEAALRRRMERARIEIGARLADAASLADALTTWRETEEYVTRRLVSHDPTHVGDLMRALSKRFALAQESGHADHGVPTGLPTLDHLTRGMRPQRMIVLAARTSIGKTALGANLVANAAMAGYPTLFFSAEMDRDSISETLFGAACRANPQAILSGEGIPETDYERVLTALAAFAQAPLWVDDTPRIEPAAIKAIVRRAIIEHGIRLVLIDYLQLLQPPPIEGKPNREQQVAAISRELLAISRELRVPVVVLAQLGRGNEKEVREPRLTDLRESGSLEQDAHDVWLLHREDRDSTEAVLIVAKQRNGPLGRIPLRFTGRHQRFEEAPEDAPTDQRAWEADATEPDWGPPNFD